MRAKDGFMLRNIVDSWVLIPIGSKVVDFNGMMLLSDTGAFLWNCLKEEKSTEELLAILQGEYEVDEATARADVDEFLWQLREGDLLA
jgi:hypothetical protein